jgi:hypothetical protein
MQEPAARRLQQLEAATDRLDALQRVLAAVSASNLPPETELALLRGLILELGRDG